MEFDLGWTGVLTEVDTLALELTLALLGYALSSARAAKRAITMEVDAEDKTLWDLIGTLPVSYQPDWLNPERPTRPLHADPNPANPPGPAPSSFPSSG